MALAGDGLRRIFTRSVVATMAISAEDDIGIVTWVGDPNSVLAISFSIGYPDPYFVATIVVHRGT